MFRPFQRLDDAPQATGIGLGLAVAKGFTEAMGGSLTAEATPGGGLTMVIRLPLSTGTPYDGHRAQAPFEPRSLVARRGHALPAHRPDRTPHDGRPGRRRRPAPARALRITLQAHGYTVTTAVDGTSALLAATQNPLSLIILDLGLPDIDGTRVLKELRGFSSAPVLVLSARHGSEDKVEALDAGADDYITKPFGLDELLARLRALLRRSVEPEREAVVRTDAFTVDLAKHRVTRDGEDVRLTPTEWKILEVLVRNPEKLITQQQLLSRVWGPAYAKETNYLRVYMAQLRRKLEPDTASPRHLLTEAGIGYRFMP